MNNPVDYSKYKTLHEVAKRSNPTIFAYLNTTGEGPAEFFMKWDGYNIFPIPINWTNEIYIGGDHSSIPYWRELTELEKMRVGRAQSTAFPTTIPGMISQAISGIGFDLNSAINFRIDELDKITLYRLAILHAEISRSGLPITSESNVNVASHIDSLARTMAMLPD